MRNTCNYIASLHYIITLRRPISVIVFRGCVSIVVVLYNIYKRWFNILYLEFMLTKLKAMGTPSAGPIKCTLCWGMSRGPKKFQV